MTALRDRAVSGIKWSAISQFGRQGTQLLTTVILARLLSPSDFGLLGMAMVVIGFIGIFKDLGTAAAIIQREELSESLLPSIFWVNVGFGTVATIVLFLLAPLCGTLYQEPRVVAVLQVLSMTFFISGLSILHQALLERSLAFHLLAKLEIASVIAGGIIGIGLAFANAGVWSLVFQSVTTVFLTTILLWLSSPWRPQWVFRWVDIKTISSFSLNLTGYSIFNYFARNADYFLIGRYLGTQELGYYTLAYRILLFPLQNISAVIGRVMYPILSTIQDDDERFASAYLKVAASISLVSFPLMMGILALAKPFVLTFFGEKWQPVILLVTILAPIGLVQSIGTSVGSIYQAKGRTDWMFNWGIGSGTLAIVAFVIGLHWGIAGVAIAYAAVSLILLYPNFSIPFRLVGLKFVELLRVLMPSFINSSLMFVVLVTFRMFLSSSVSNAMIFVLLFTCGAVVYATACWITSREQLKELWDLTKSNRMKLHDNR